MKAMMLTAGLGTRLRPVTDVFAKPAIPFLNIPLLYYPLVTMEMAGAKEFVFNTHYRPEQITALVENIPMFSGSVHISPEIEKPLGSGGGVWRARQWLDRAGDFIVANGDEVIIPSSWNVPHAFIKAHKDAQALATIFVMDHKGVGTQFGGVWTDAQGLVHGFGKQKPESKVELRGLHYVGLILLSDRVFKYLPEGESNLLYDALIAGIKNGERVQTFTDRCVWYETGNVADFIEASGLLLKAPTRGIEKSFIKEIGKRFWKGQPNLELINSGNPCLIGAGAKFDGKPNIKGFAVIGDDCVIGKDCVIEESVLLPGAKLADGTKVHRQIILPS